MSASWAEASRACGPPSRPSRRRLQLDIVILESDLCGAGARGPNGGYLLTWSAKYFTLGRLFGEPEAVRLVKASEAAATPCG